jgi:hypothetical protein
MHHYLEHTSKTLAEHCNDEKKAYAWQSAVPELALCNPCVAHSLLAMAALCLCHDRLREEIGSTEKNSDIAYQSSHSQRGSEASTRASGGYRKYFMLAEMHHGKSLSNMQAELSKENGSMRSSDAIFATSCLLTVFAPAYMNVFQLRSRLTRAKTDTGRLSLSTASTPGRLPHDSGSDEPTLIDWFILLRGVSLTEPPQSEQRSLGSPGQALRQFDNLVPILPEFTMPSSPQPAAYRHPLYPVICATKDSAFTRLEHLVVAYTQTISGLPTQSRLQSCLSALEILKNATAHLCNWTTHHSYNSSTQPAIYDRSPSRSIMAWIARVPGSFVKLLKQGDLMAEAVLAMFLVFMILLEETWWAGGLGKEELKKVVSRRIGKESDDDDDDGKWLEWPVSILAVMKEMEKFGDNEG